MTPTDISLAPAAVAENQPAGTLVGILTTADPDLPGDAHTYALVSGWICSRQAPPPYGPGG